MWISAKQPSNPCYPQNRSRPAPLCTRPTQTGMRRQMGSCLQVMIGLAWCLSPSPTILGSSRTRRHLRRHNCRPPGTTHPGPSPAMAPYKPFPFLALKGKDGQILELEPALWQGWGAEITSHPHLLLFKHSLFALGISSLCLFPRPVSVDFSLPPFSLLSSFFLVYHPSQVSTFWKEDGVWFSTTNRHAGGVGT